MRLSDGYANNLNRRLDLTKLARSFCLECRCQRHTDELDRAKGDLGFALLDIEPQAMPRSQELGHMKTDIMAVFFVGFAWIAQADDEFHGMASNKWQVASGKWQVASGRWQVRGDRC